MTRSGTGWPKGKASAALRRVNEAGLAVVVGVEVVGVDADDGDGDGFLVWGEVAAVECVAGQVGEAGFVGGVAVGCGVV